MVHPGGKEPDEGASPGYHKNPMASNSICVGKGQDMALDPPFREFGKEQDHAQGRAWGTHDASPFPVTASSTAANFRAMATWEQVSTSSSRGV